jgi:hypothetical protein
VGLALRCATGLRGPLASVAGVEGGNTRDISAVCRPDDMSPPEWWNMPPDARLVSNRDLEFTRMSMWYSRTENRVWIFYEQ